MPQKTGQRFRREKLSCFLFYKGNIAQRASGDFVRYCLPYFVERNLETDYKQIGSKKEG